MCPEYRFLHPKTIRYNDVRIHEVLNIQQAGWAVE
jgi:hypothetical protein